MEVTFPFGDGLLAVDLPSETIVVEPTYVPGVTDEPAAIRDSIRSPVAGPALRDLLQKDMKIAIAICDITRPQPRKIMIPVILEEIAEVVDLSNVVVINATGTHRGNTPAELEEMLGSDVLNAVRVINHDARDESSLTYCGEMGNGVPVYLNSEWVNADFKITTGFVEPHFFAGFSGGPKLIAPGMAGIATTLVLHDARRIGDARATWAVTVGNPVHDDVRAIAKQTGVDFSCDVVLNRDQQIVKAFSGEMFAMHEQACAFAKEVAMQELPHLFDIVVTSNSGYPLDQNLYQAIKGMSAAADIVKPGGLIISVAECRDGFPEHGLYYSLVSSPATPSEILQSILATETTKPDQWQAQIQCRILEKARVGVHAAGLNEHQIRSVHFESVDDVHQEVRAELDRLKREGIDGRVCALRDGPISIPYVA